MAENNLADDLKKATSAFSVREGEYIPQEKIIDSSGQETAPGDDDVSSFTPSPYWTVLKDKFGVDLPEDLSAENEVEVFGKVIETIKPEPVKLHPMVVDLNNKLTDPEFKIENWLAELNANQNLLALTGKEFLNKALALDYPDATPEDIEQAVDDMERAGSLKVQELERKKQIKLRQQNEEKDYAKRIEDEQKQAILEADRKTQDELNKLFANSKKVTEIYGIPISEAERDSFNRTFAELARRDETGRMPLMDFLQSDEDIWKYVYWRINGDKKMKEALFNAKEGTKAEVWKKLKITPTTGPGTPTGAPGSAKPDYKSLTIPQQ